jgi:hypothetical protein
MSGNVFTYAQTVLLRTAIDLVASRIEDGEARRKQIASALLDIEDYADYDAATLTQLVLSKMEARGRKSA